MANNEWLMPSYFKQFKCKCGQCRHTCCHGWKIPVSQEEYYRLVTMPCNEELRHSLDVSFVDPDYATSENFKVISFNYFGDCPIQKDGLCQIQKEFGEDMLPAVCRLYPRSLKQVNGQLIACCSSSCERVIELLIENGTLGMHMEKMEGKPTLSYDIDDDYIQQLSHFQKLLQDRSTTLVQSIMEICLEINRSEFSKDYNCESNPLTVALGLLDRLATEGTFLADIEDVIVERYKDNYIQFEEDKLSFEKRFPDWMYIFENVLNNSLLYENFPFVDDRFNKTDAYKGICTSYGLLRLICIGYTAQHQSQEDLIDCIACLFHLIDHTSFYYNVSVIVDSPAILLKL